MVKENTYRPAGAFCVILQHAYCFLQQAKVILVNSEQDTGQIVAAGCTRIGHESKRNTKRTTLRNLR
jgi:hypothetical protein